MIHTATQPLTAADPHPEAERADPADTSTTARTEMAISPSTSADRMRKTCSEACLETCSADQEVQDSEEAGFPEAQVLADSDSVISMTEPEPMEAELIAVEPEDGHPASSRWI